MLQRCLGNELVPFYIFFLDLVFLSLFLPCPHGTGAWVVVWARIFVALLVD